MFASWQSEKNSKTQINSDFGLFLDSGDTTFASVGDIGSDISIRADLVMRVHADLLGRVINHSQRKKSIGYLPSQQPSMHESLKISQLDMMAFMSNVHQLPNHVLEGYCCILIRHDLKKIWMMHHGNSQFGIAHDTTVDWLTTPQQTSKNLDTPNVTFVELDYDENANYILATDGYWDKETKKVDSTSHLLLSVTDTLPPYNRDANNFKVIGFIGPEPQQAKQSEYFGPLQD